MEVLKTFGHFSIFASLFFKSEWETWRKFLKLHILLEHIILLWFESMTWSSNLERYFFSLVLKNYLKKNLISLPTNSFLIQIGNLLSSRLTLQKMHFLKFSGLPVNTKIAFFFWNLTNTAYNGANKFWSSIWIVIH